MTRKKSGNTKKISDIPMVDARKPNYLETILQIEDLMFLIEKIEKNILSQLPQGITKEFLATKKEFFDWVEEAQFTLEEYNTKIRHD